jgi:hypothetical protein
VGAYVLAGELANGNYAAAFAVYEEQMIRGGEPEAGTAITLRDYR